jgi:hypothetical protein
VERNISLLIGPLTVQVPPPPTPKAMTVTLGSHPSGIGFWCREEGDVLMNYFTRPTIGTVGTGDKTLFWE